MTEVQQDSQEQPVRKLKKKSSTKKLEKTTVKDVELLIQTTSEMSQSVEKIKVEVCSHPSIVLPQYKTTGAAGCDVCANISLPLWIKPGESKMIPTGLKVRIPAGYELQVRPRSGLALKNGVTLLNCVGTIDSDYRDEIGVILINHGSDNFQVNKGDRIAQLVMQKVEQFNWVKVTEEEFQSSNDKEVNNRTGGFGSTGK